MTTIHPDCQMPDGAEPCLGFQELQQQHDDVYRKFEAAVIREGKLREALKKIDAECYAGDPVKEIAQRALSGSLRED